MLRVVPRRLRSWTLRDCAALIESVLVAVLIEVALPLLPMSTILRMVEGIPSKRMANPLEAHPERLVRWASAPYRLFGLSANCLRRSLVLCALLRRRGVTAHLCFGVDRAGSALAAHAWVAIAGVSTEMIPSRFHELPRPWSV